MRYDLEFTFVDEITKDDLDILSENLYGDNSSIEVAKFDNKGLFSRYDYSSALYGDKIKRPLLDKYFLSGISLYNKPLIKSLIFESYKTFPVINPGNFYSNKYLHTISTNAIYKKLTFDPDKDLKEDNTSVTDIYTLRFKDPGTYNKEKEFTFVPYYKSVEETFRRSTDDYKYTIVDNKIYTNLDKIVYTNFKIGVITPQDNMFALPEFPAHNLSIDGFESFEFEVFNGIVIFKEGAVKRNMDLLVTYTVYPIIELKNTREERDVFFNTDISPISLSYSNGLLALVNTYKKSDIPVSLSISTDRETIEGNEICNIVAAAKTFNDIPLKNKNIVFSIDNPLVKFVNSNLNTVKVKTNTSGKAKVSLVINKKNVGHYIQLGWVDNSAEDITKINLPYALDASEFFLYYVMSKDPLVDSSLNTVKYYPSNNISTYFCSGRKVACIKFDKDAEDSDLLATKFIKGIKVDTTKGTVRAEELGNPAIDLEYPILTTIEFPKITEPSNNLVGYWLISQGNIRINAKIEDTAIETSSKLTIRNVTREKPFVINKYTYHKSSSRLGGFGYLTASEYIKNEFGLNVFAAYCIFGDAVYHKCNHPKAKYHNNFILSDNISCKNKKCPANNIKLLNPFIFHISEDNISRFSSDFSDIFGEDYYVLPGYVDDGYIETHLRGPGSNIYVLSDYVESEYV